MRRWPRPDPWDELISGPKQTAAIHTEGLSKSYGGVPALDELSMTVPRGEIFGFLGPNGAGKTTAVKLLLGLAAPTSGRAWILGRPAGDTAARAGVGYLPELFRYQGWMTAAEVLKLHCELAGLPSALHPAQVEEALVGVGLADRAHDRVAGYSKGMQQRLGLGAALLGTPDVVFLDEPTSALDPVGRKQVRDIILGLKGRGATVFLNSHLLSEVEQVCDRVAMVQRGRVVASGTMAEILGTDEVRVRVTGLDPARLARLERFGTVAWSGDQLTVAGIGAEAVPELVAALVELGASVHAVRRAARTLEERFIELVGEMP